MNPLVVELALQQTECPCRQCELERSHYHEWGQPQYMIVCPACGNKRCPHASHHDNACTNSNEPGQAGSVYA